MKAFLKSLTLENFKGVKKQTYNFSEKTKIFGRNASGKTTIFDGFMFLLFNKDSNGNEKFSIRPLDKDGKQIDNVEIKVVATLDIDGKEVELSKVQKQNWVKKRGTSEAVLQGNVNSYEIDGYPKAEKEFKQYISELVSEDIFKMITSPAYFPNLAWKDQRAIIMRFVEDISDVDLARQNGEFSELIDELEKAPSTDDIQKKYQKALTEWKKKQTEIPVRIDELSAQKTDIDVAELELQRNALKEQIAENKEKQEDASKQYEEYQKLADEVTKLKMQLSDMQRVANEDNSKKRKEISDKISALDSEIAGFESDIRKDELYISSSSHNCETFKKQLEGCRNDYRRAQELKFDENSLICSYCGQEYPEDKKDALRAEFESHKAQELDRITRNGNDLKSIIEAQAKERGECQKRIEKNRELISERNKSIEELNAELEKLPQSVDISDTAEYKSLSQQISDKESAMQDFKEDTARQQLKAKLDTLNEQSTEVERQIAKAEQNVKIDDRIVELQTEQREVAQKVADQEKMLYLLEQFIRYKMDRVSDSINEKFDGVSFKLFEVQINSGIRECCEVTYNGVPYQSLNSGHRIVAGLKIIKALQELYNVYPCVFIDNAESINECNVPEMDCQMIFLSVDDGDLRIE